MEILHQRFVAPIHCEVLGRQNSGRVGQVQLSYVLATSAMDRYLFYVALTRHRHQADICVGREGFKDLARKQQGIY
ncbi:MAG TPA: hypothetical protein VMU16_02870 [Candidatus Binataceae bacterium]|nr:hypothetical protein [Candidatus Binataceae bacterium]